MKTLKSSTEHQLPHKNEDIKFIKKVLLLFEYQLLL